MHTVYCELLRNYGILLPSHSLPVPGPAFPFMHHTPLLYGILQTFKYCQFSQADPEAFANGSPALNVPCPFLLVGYNLDTHLQSEGSVDHLSDCIHGFVTIILCDI